MPRLSDEAIKQGFLHPDADVRFESLHYFSEALKPDPSVMPVVIDALERFGRIGAFRFNHPISDLAQTESTVRWAIEELRSRPHRTEDEQHYLDAVARLLIHADPRIVRLHETDIVATSTLKREYRERLVRRLRYLDWDDDALWRELAAVCEDGKSKQYVGDMRWSDGQDLVEELGRRGDRNADRTMDLLAIEVNEYENNPQKWMEPLAIRLAGELHLEQAIPLILDKLHQDGDVVNEECQTALVRIGTDAAVQAVHDAYPTAEWHFRLYATGALGRIHTDLAVNAGIELLGTEKDLDLQTWLALSLVEHFSTEGNEVARQALLADLDQRDLRDKLVVACTLMGQEFPELEGWRKEIRDEKQRKPFMFGGPLPSPPVARVSIPPKTLAPVQRIEQRVGRNDRCPCGSGKKFKQCCLRK